MADRDPVLTADRVSRSFGSTVALSEVSIEIEPGKVHTILGENGSGKSTLVKILSGVLPPDSGRVQVGREDLRPARPQRARRLGVATVFQEVLVAPNRSVLENAMLGRDSLFALRRTIRRHRTSVDDVLRELTGAGWDLDEKAGELSLVRRHQVAMARAILLNPKILILDESTAALDIGDRDRLFDLVRSRLEMGAAVVFISHRMEEVLELSDRVTVLRSGVVVDELDRAELSSRRLLELLNPESAA